MHVSSRVYPSFSLTAYLKFNDYRNTVVMRLYHDPDDRGVKQVIKPIIYVVFPILYLYIAAFSLAETIARIALSFIFVPVSFISQNVGVFEYAKNGVYYSHSAFYHSLYCFLFQLRYPNVYCRGATII